MASQHRALLPSCLLLVLAAALSLLVCSASARNAHLPTVLGIDFGSEYIKIGYVSRGKPIDLILNEQSKRKTSNFIGFRKESERLFGENARQMASRFPAASARYYSQMFAGKRFALAKDFLQERCQNQLGINAWSWRENQERSTAELILTGEDNVQQIYQSEELMAYMLKYIVGLVDPNSQHVTGVIVTVPPYFSVEQRQAVRDAAKLANVRLLGLMHETTALAIQYGVSRFSKIKKQLDSEGSKKKKNREHNVIFFDMGATSTKVVIAQYTPPKKKGLLDLGNLKILSTKWNDFVGGEDFTTRLALHLAKKFQEKHNVDLTKKQRVMERLRAFAKKAKEVLTANSETIVFMETLYNDIDFKVTVSREEFEDMCSDLIEQTLVPVRAALTESKLKMKHVDALEVVGGGSRVVAVQQKLNQFYRKGVSHSLNGDESIALGSALHAATLSPMFRVRSFKIEDAYPYEIEFILSGSGDIPEKKYTLFKKGDSMDLKRFVTIPRMEDFDITLKYSDETRPRSFPENGQLAKFHFKNVKESMKDFNAALEKDEEAKAKVRIGFELTPAGMLRIHSAQGSLEQFEMVPIEPPKSENSTTTTEEGEESSEADKKEVEYKKEKRVSKTNIDYEVTSYTLPSLTEEQLNTMTQRMEKFEELERVKQLIAKARNELEGRVYGTQNMLYDDDYEPFYVEEESEKLSELLTATDDWLMETDEDMSVSVEDYKTKLQEIDAIAQPIKDRREEVSKRAEQVDACKELAKTTRKVMSELEKSSPHITEQERNNVLSTVENTEKWIEEQLKKQESVPLSQPPVVTHEEIRNQCAKMHTMTLLLVNKPKPEPPKEEEIKTNATKEEAPEKEEDSQQTQKDEL